MKNHKNCLDWGLLVLRVAFGIVFILHGYSKLFGTPGIVGVTGMISGIGFPLPGFFAYVVALAELVGGLAVLLGVFVPFFATLNAIDMLVAFFAIKHARFPMGDIEFTLLCLSVALGLMGPGRLSVQCLLMKKGDDKECCGGGCCDHSKS